MQSVKSTVKERLAWNGARFRSGDRAGHYESWFQRANHPERPLAFWIRYTAFVPKGRPEAAEGERWAVWFDGEQDRVVAAKDEVPIAECGFTPEGLHATIGDSVLRDGHLRGRVDALGWDLTYAGDEPPLLLLPRRFYDRGFPKAKAVVGTPHASYSGTMEVEGEVHTIDRWPGSQNHNWGVRHTDHYAWGQVSGFDDDPDAFLECSTARVKLGPLWTPWLTLLVLRTADAEYRLNGLGRALRAQGRFEYFDWRFASAEGEVAIEGRIHGRREAFVALPYRNPPGGTKTCLNTKIAACELTLRTGDTQRTLRSAHRAAFEILCDDTTGHGVSRIDD